MTLTLCVLLWARSGAEDGLIAYEDRVLSIVPEHGGQVLQRARGSGTAGQPLEIQLLGFPSAQALDAYMTDPRRQSLAGERDKVIAKTEVIEVQLTEPGAVTMSTHQPDQSVFRSVLAENVDWEPFAAFPPSARLAVVVGHPPEPGPYVVRVKLPSGVKLMPHWHHEDRVYTVLSGVFYIGLGEEFEEEKLQAYPPGAVVVLPGGTRHFHWAKSGEYVTQVTAIGPISLEYVDPDDDPRNK